MNTPVQEVFVGAKTSAPTPSPTSNMTSNASNLAGKRIGMVMFSFYPWDPRPRRIADTLIKAGASIELICLEDEKSPKRAMENGLDVTRLGIEHNRGGKLNYAYQYSAFIFLSSLILAWRSLKKRYDLIYVHNMPDVLVACGIIPKLFGAKVILDQHDPMPELMTTIYGLGENSSSVRIIKMLEKWSMARATKVLTVNVACKKIFGARSCALDKVGVVMNAPDPKIFPFRAARTYPVETSPNKPFVIMYHGSLVERNGVDLAVKSLVRVRKNVPNAELKIYGKQNAFIDQVMEDAKKLGLADCVKFLGPRKLEELINEIQLCDVGVIPNQRNAFTDINTPTRIFEYLALGKPVIAPNTPGIVDYFTPESLFFFESGNADQLAQQIEYVAANPREAVDVAERGQEIYKAHTWDEEKKTLLDVIGGLWAGSKK
jgi:glycosyltransferase involved in cell wall biosynthesis